jgi:two-component system, OmpR family, KDP operon response regulator KdpE
MMEKILIIDDEPQIRRFLRIGLGSQGYHILEAETGKKGMELVALESPQLVVLDLGLPDIDGLEVLNSIRDFYQGPILILSVRSRENEKVAALDAGANDYVVKPVGIQELLARIRVLLRSSEVNKLEVSAFREGELQLDVLQHRVTLKGDSLHLSRKEFQLLKLLMEYPDRVLTHRQLISQLWGDSHSEDNHYLRILVKKLRSKLNDDPGAPRYIETEPGVGYRFLPAANDSDSDSASS